MMKNSSIFRVMAGLSGVCTRKPGPPESTAGSAWLDMDASSPARADVSR